MARTKEQNKEYCARYHAKNRESHNAKMREYGKSYYLKNKDSVSAKNKAHRELEKIVNPEHRMARSKRADANKISKNEKLLISMSGRPRPDICEVCEGSSPRKDGTRRIVFDHDHATGQFRGWLCNRCNVVLGFLQDDVLVIEKLLNYLKSGGIGYGPSIESVNSILENIEILSKPNE